MSRTRAAGSVRYPHRRGNVRPGVLPIRSAHRHQRAALAEALGHRHAVDEPDLVVFSVDAVHRGRRQHRPPLIHLRIEQLPHLRMLDNVRVRVHDAWHGDLRWASIDPLCEPRFRSGGVVAERSLSSSG